MLIVTNDTQTFNVPIFRSPFVDDTLVMRLHNKTTNEDVLIHPDSCDIHTTYVTITADLSNLYGGEWEYRLTNTDEDGYVIVASQGTMYVNQLARFTDANAERTYSTRESVRGGVCPPCPPCPNTYSINVTADLEMASVAGSCDSVEENAAIYIGCVPRSGYRFSQWSDGNNENPRRVVADGNKTYTAICEAVPPTPTTTTHTISVTADEHSTAIGGGVYEENTTASIGIVAAKGYRFVSWSDGNVENPRQVLVDADKNYTAVVEQIPTYNVTATTTPYTTNLIDVVGTGTFYEGGRTTISCNVKSGGGFLTPYTKYGALYRNGELVYDIIPLPYTIENVDADYSVKIKLGKVEMRRAIIKLVDESGTDIGTITDPSGSVEYANYFYYSDDTNPYLGVLNAAKEGYKFLRWSDGNTDNPRAVKASMLLFSHTLTAIMERVQEGDNKRVNIENNDAVEIFCPQREGTIGSVLPWRVKKARHFVVVDFDSSYNQQYQGGGINDTAIWSINNYQDHRPWQGLIMLSDDDSRNIIKYNVNQHSVDFGTTAQYTTGSETFVSIEGDADGVLYERNDVGFSDIFDYVVVSSMTNKFFKNSGVLGGVNYMFATNTNYWEICMNPDTYLLSLKSFSSCLYSADVADVVYYKNTGNEFIIEFAKDNGGEHYNIVQWHIGINDSYVYCVLNNWTDNIYSVWWCNDYYKNNNTAFLGTDGVVKYCRDYGYAMPWDMTHESVQLSYVPTDGTKFGFITQANDPKRLDIEVAYSEKVTFYDNFQNVCQPYSNNSDDFIVGDKHISETTGVNFYEFVGDRLPMVSQNALYLSKYEVKSVMPDITMLQDGFMNGTRLNDWSWLFDKLPNISTIENGVLVSSGIQTFEPSVGQCSQLTTIGSDFLFYSMVERVDFTNLTNLTILRSNLCGYCGNLTYANISKLKDLTEYDNSGWFQSCPNLRDIVFDGTTDQYRDKLGSLSYFDNKYNCTLHVASEYLQDYIDMFGVEWGSIVPIE